MSKDLGQLALLQAKEFGGKLEVKSKLEVKNKEDLSIAYTPGVATVSLEIAKDSKLGYELTTKKIP